MEFVHQAYEPGETVAAICTPPGEGGLAVIRISGDEALSVADTVFSGAVRKYKTHTVHYGLIIDAAGARIDDVLLTVMHGPRTYTGEDTVEISCHGGSIVTRKVLERILAAGARAARPGEFTFKAFMNGKIDLAQAEAVQELISANNEHAFDAAAEQLQGRLSQKVAGFQKQLTETAAILEAWVDFPEEDLEFATVDQLCTQLATSVTAMQELVDTFHDGRIVHDGISLALVGSPNVGKSSLMNALLDKERAIVSDIAGTTRDIVEDHIRLNGLNVKLIDTAGIRSGAEAIEQEGIRRSHAAMKEADLVLMVADATRPLTAEEAELLQGLPGDKTILVWNKIDIATDVPDDTVKPRSVALSAKEGRGLEALHATIDDVVWEKGPPERGEVVITNMRHKEALTKAIDAAERLGAGLRTGTSPEFLTMEMRDCLNQLGLICGTNIGEDILSAIFSKFCIGK